ncbi:Protein phosphatase 1 regulatory subunit 32 [Clonorchis sinensis]|uniref:Protein phosphatase 1 regulatory subunit 32 n=1 Tax=Clonorchis sinensis TaxID=79923 RepID=A0A8T1M8G9_CLOSI|nr:Protein phosphatase 1 regulatory subunit 32 [Clonorchis sinensis]
MYAGTVSEHVKQSRGGETDVLNHYCTSYKTSYGQHWEPFKPKTVSLYGSGFVANQRPVIQYTPGMDDIDNKKMKDILKTNYLSVTHKDFVPYSRQNGREPIPSLSKFNLPNKYGKPHLKDNMTLIDDNLQGSVISVLPKHTPLLHSKRNKGDVEAENYGFGPNRNQSTYQAQFGRPLLPKDKLTSFQMGPKEETGSTRNNCMEDTLTGRPISPHLMSDFRGQTDRPTGRTNYNDEYVPYGRPDGKEAFARWIAPPASTHKDSYVKETKVWPDYVPVHPSNVYDKANEIPERKLDWLKKNDPAEYQNAIHAYKEPSMEKGTYLGHQVEPPSKVTKLGKQTSGPLTSSGFTSNEHGHVEYDAGPPDRFVTHYMTRFYEPPPGTNPEDREGHVHFNVQPTKINVRATDAGINKLEPQKTALSKTDSLPAYQARSVLARDQVGLQSSRRSLC